MEFDELDRRMREYETAHDHCVMAGIYIVARLDGRNFTRLTKETMTFEAPFDVRMRDTMTATVEHLMQCGFNILYGYTESDEISLLFHPQENSFGRKERKINSILAGEASATFSLRLGTMGTFDCRVCQLPNQDLVLDYFRWRQEDAHRNALNAHCYWTLRKEGQSPRQATHQLEKLSVADKNELLYQRGINFNELPAWQKRGVGVTWEQIEKVGMNPITQEQQIALRRRLRLHYDLPLKEEYAQWLRAILTIPPSTIGAF